MACDIGVTLHRHGVLCLPVVLSITGHSRRMLLLWVKSSKIRALCKRRMKA